MLVYVVLMSNIKWTSIHFGRRWRRRQQQTAATHKWWRVVRLHFFLGGFKTINGRTYVFLCEEALHFYHDAIIWHPTFDSPPDIYVMLMTHKENTITMMMIMMTTTKTTTTTKHISFERYNFITTMWVSMRKSLRKNKARHSWNRNTHTHTK